MAEPIAPASNATPHFATGVENQLASAHNFMTEASHARPRRAYTTWPRSTLPSLQPCLSNFRRSKAMPSAVFDALVNIATRMKSRAAFRPNSAQ